MLQGRKDFVDSTLKTSEISTVSFLVKMPPQQIQLST